LNAYMGPLASSGKFHMQVDDCIAKYHWMRAMLTRVAEAKRQGKPMPKSIEDMERSVGGAPKR